MQQSPCVAWKWWAISRLEEIQTNALRNESEPKETKTTVTCIEWKLTNKESKIREVFHYLYVRVHMKNSEQSLNSHEKLVFERLNWIELDCMPFFLISCLHLHLEYQSICLWVHRLCFYCIYSSFFAVLKLSARTHSSQWKCVLSMPSLYSSCNISLITLFFIAQRCVLYFILYTSAAAAASQFMTHEPPLIINFCGKCVCFYPYLYI